MDVFIAAEYTYCIVFWFTVIISAHYYEVVDEGEKEGGGKGKNAQRVLIYHQPAIARKCSGPTIRKINTKSQPNISQIG